MSKLRGTAVGKVRSRFGNTVINAGTIAVLLFGGLVAAWMAMWMVHYMAEFVRWLPVPHELA